MIHSGTNLIDGIPVEVIRKLNKREFEPTTPVLPKPVRLVQSDFTATLLG